MKRMTTAITSIVLFFALGAGAAAPSDADIQKCITDKFAAAPKLKEQGFSAMVSKGEATLTGTAKNPGSKGAAIGIAKRCGAQKVTNSITVKTPAQAKPGKAPTEKTSETPKKPL